MLWSLSRGAEEEIILTKQERSEMRIPSFGTEGGSTSRHERRPKHGGEEGLTPKVQKGVLSTADFISDAEQKEEHTKN